MISLVFLTHIRTASIFLQLFWKIFSQIITEKNVDPLPTTDLSLSCFVKISIFVYQDSWAGLHGRREVKLCCE